MPKTNNQNKETKKVLINILTYFLSLIRFNLLNFQDTLEEINKNFSLAHFLV